MMQKWLAEIEKWQMIKMEQTLRDDGGDGTENNVSTRFEDDDVETTVYKAKHTKVIVI